MCKNISIRYLQQLGNTEWIEGPNGINAVTAIKIDPESQSFQLDTLNLAKKVYDMLNRIAVSGKAIS